MEKIKCYYHLKEACSAYKYGYCIDPYTHNRDCQYMKKEMKKETEKRCTNCKYTNLLKREKPCLKCSFKNLWKPMKKEIIKNCSNCANNSSSMNSVLCGVIDGIECNHSGSWRSWKSKEKYIWEKIMKESRKESYFMITKVKMNKENDTKTVMSKVEEFNKTIDKEIEKEEVKNNMEKSEKLEKRIEEIKEKRKKYLEELTSFLRKYPNCTTHSGKHYTTDFIKYIFSSENIPKKEFKKELLFYLKYYHCLHNKIYKYREWGNNINEYPIAYSIEKWNQFKRTIELVKKHALDFNNKHLQKELKRLTNCYRDISGKNPCTQICEKCGVENQLKANFCSNCGGRFK